MSGYKRKKKKKKKWYEPQTTQSWGFVTDFYAPIWVMGFHAFYHQTIIFTGKNGVYQPWTRCHLK